jgi:ATP-dependent helicase/DNAse subunit B
MSATVTILCGPAGSGKTGRLLERFRSRARAAPGSALWLGPTRRGVEAALESWGDASSDPGSLLLLTFSEFINGLLRAHDPGMRPLSGVQRRLLLDDVISRLQEDGELSYFERVIDTRGFRDGVSGLLGELQRLGISSTRFMKATSRRGDGASPKQLQCARLYDRFQRELQRHNLLDEEGSAERARALLREGRCEPFSEVRAVFVDGFTDFTRSQQGLLAALAARVEELWLTLPDENGDDRAELFARSRATLERLRELNSPALLREERLNAAPAGATLFDTRPAGLRHLERQLFQPHWSLTPPDDAEGVSCIEAPGPLGEARLVARRIKLLLREGARPDDVLVILRDLAPYADLIHEVFDEYEVPLDLDFADPLTRNPAVAVLLRALRLPEDDWPFAGVTALLRNTYFRPGWPETGGRPEMPQRAEVLLRLLREPRGREAYLAAARRWAEQPQPGLEDEQAEESRRRRTHELAKECGTFLERFFRAWDDAPARARLADHVAWLRGFADDLGVTRAAAEDAKDAEALDCLWRELDAWIGREEAGRGKRGATLDRRRFHGRLASLAGEAALARTPPGPGRVRVLAVPQARHLPADHVFLMGLGELGFPRLTPPPSLLDDPERQALQQAGIDLPPAGDLMPEEMLLFYQAVTRARRSLVLSYPAVDERGQDLLPSSFYLSALECFRPGVVPVERRRMLLEAFDRDEPLSPAEYRVRIAAHWYEGAACHWQLAASATPLDLPRDLKANLADAAELVRWRFREGRHNPYDGLFRDEAVVAELAGRFGSEKVFSPTALEDYVACPFRFFLRHVLHLEPLEEPREEIEVTRRGQAFHRALARLHRNLKKADVHHPDESVEERVLEEVRTAVAEDVRRAPSLASKELWRLEGERLLRSAARYGGHWRKFLAPWLERGVAPRPYEFEVDFGLPSATGEAPRGPLMIRDGEIEVRVSGRIDRVDVVELADGVGFWVIDYKTGRSSHYTSADLVEFRRLQLMLYALAVEEVLLAGRDARPLGLAYWLVSESGPKVALPASRSQVVWLDESQRWRAIRERLQGWVVTLADHIRRGRFPLQPRSDTCTQTCAFGQVCRITQARAVAKEWDLPLPSADG